MSSSPSPIVRGYLLLADISGYTSFLSQTELDHAQEILSDLLGVVIKRFQSLLSIHKIEGDAVFAYALDARIVRGETLLELIESTYVDFRERMRNVRRHTTCTCQACRSIPMLDLKFILHHGDFVVQHIGSTLELAGSDVNLVHRLLKNHVVDRTGWRAYALFTAPALVCMSVQPEHLVAGAESYEHLGEVTTQAMDLQARYEALMQARRVVVEDDEAAISFDVDVDVPPPVAWSWMNDPAKRSLYTRAGQNLTFVPILRPGGRTAAGATTHCVHGATLDMREIVLDWKPFDYYTVKQESGPFSTILVTFRLTPLADGARTRLHLSLKGTDGRLPAPLHRTFTRFIYTRLFDYRSVALKLKEILDQAAAELPPPPPAV